MAATNPGYYERVPILPQYYQGCWWHGARPPNKQGVGGREALGHDMREGWWLRDLILAFRKDFSFPGKQPFPFPAFQKGFLFQGNGHPFSSCLKFSGEFYRSPKFSGEVFGSWSQVMVIIGVLGQKIFWEVFWLWGQGVLTG